METKEITMRVQRTDSQLQANFKVVMQHLVQVAIDKKLLITDNGEIVDNLEYIIPDLSKLTKTGKKKLAKRLYFASKNKDLKRINSFFHYLNHNLLGVKPIKFNYSNKEKLIKESRFEYLKAKLVYEAALAKYKETKGDFYKS